jgi:hypothetical protein
MGNQRTFASMAWNGKGKVTRRERFLGEMDAVIPWPRLVRLIEPHSPKLAKVGSRSDWSTCCGFTSFSNGSTCRTRRRKTRALRQ